MMQEADNVPALLRALRRQGCQRFSLYVCVNHPDDAPHEVVADNARTLEMLAASGRVGDSEPVILQRVWHGKKRGVGWARKALFDEIVGQAGDDELVVSLDADTDVAPHYLSALLAASNRHPEASACVVPYYHRLVGVEPADRAILRYELYMRHYCLGLRLAGSPYAFTAIGSAMAFPAWAYRRVGGITPLQGGEDFYLMQKFAKTGSLCYPQGVCVFPSSRPSRRVPFGTGPAVAAGLCAMGARYPFFPLGAYDALRATYALFPVLYEGDVETPMSPFLRRQLATDDLWGPLRRTFKSQARFIHACHERVDGLRILQYLRTFPQEASAFGDLFPRLGLPRPAAVDFAATPVPQVDALRNMLFDKEGATAPSNDTPGE